MKTLIVFFVAASLTGCATMPGVSGDISNAQAQYLAAQQAERDAQRQDRRDTIDALSAFAYSTEPLIHAMAIAAIERTSGEQYRSQPAKQIPQQDGPITTVVRAVLPLAVPLAQLWMQDRAGERSLTQAMGNMDLIGTMAGQLGRDPLVVMQPDPTIINAPATMIIDRDVPMIIDRDVPLFVTPYAVPN